MNVVAWTGVLAFVEMFRHCHELAAFSLPPYIFIYQSNGVFCKLTLPSATRGEGGGPGEPAPRDGAPAVNDNTHVRTVKVPGRRPAVAESTPVRFRQLPGQNHWADAGALLDGSGQPLGPRPGGRTRRLSSWAASSAAGTGDQRCLAGGPEHGL